MGAVLAFPRDVYKTVRIRVRQGIEKHGVDHCENGRIRADPEGQCCQNRQGEPWGLPQRANDVARRS